MCMGMRCYAGSHRVTPHPVTHCMMYDVCSVLLVVYGVSYVACCMLHLSHAIGGMRSSTHNDMSCFGKRMNVSNRHSTGDEPGRVVSCHVLSCHVIISSPTAHVMSCGCHVMSYPVVSSHITSCHTVRSYHVISSPITYHVMWCHVVSYHVTSCHVISHHIPCTSHQNASPSPPSCKISSSTCSNRMYANATPGNKYNNIRGVRGRS